MKGILGRIYQRDMSARAAHLPLKSCACPACDTKDKEIATLKTQVKRLEADKEKKRSSFIAPFGSSTSSAKLTHKENSPDENQAKKGGAQKGHVPFKRTPADLSDCDRVIEVPKIERCPDCDMRMESRGVTLRKVYDINPPDIEKIVYKQRLAECPCCLKTKTPPVSALPNIQMGNALLSELAVSHYLHGIPIGTLMKKYRITFSEGSIYNALEALANICDKAQESLIKDFRSAPVRYADETGWRTDGKSGYAWFFGSNQTSIVLFGRTRAADTPNAVFGDVMLKGTTVVDRYGAYNRMNTRLQYCYAHLLRDLKDLLKGSEENTEIATFVSTVAPLLAKAMKLRNTEIDDKTFYHKASELSDEILACMNQPARSQAILCYQDIFLDNADRMFVWAQDRRVPAENNAAEREIRPTVVARKVSFGSQSDRGAKRRSVIMSVLLTAKKRLPVGADIVRWLKGALDKVSAYAESGKISLIYDELPSIQLM